MPTSAADAQSAPAKPVSLRAFLRCMQVPPPYEISRRLGPGGRSSVGRSQPPNIVEIGDSQLIDFDDAPAPDRASIAIFRDQKRQLDEDLANGVIDAGEHARLAGLPAPVLKRAKEILRQLEEDNLDDIGQPKLAKARQKKEKAKDVLRELDLFGRNEA